MKTNLRLASNCLVVLAAAVLQSSAAQAQTTRYLDVNGAAAGSGVPTGSPYNWQTAIWSTDSTGNSATSTGNWGILGDIAVLVAGADAGTYTLTLPGSGGGDQTWIRGLTVNSGSPTISVGTTNFVLGATQTWTINTGASLNVTGAGCCAGAVNMNGSSLTVDTQGTATASINGMGNSGGGLTKDGTGTLTVSANSSYTGGTMVNNGVLEVNGSSAGSGYIRGTATVNTGAELRYTGGDGTGFGFNGGNKLDTLNINGGLVNSPGSAHLWFATVNMTGGELRTNGGVSDPVGAAIQWNNSSVNTSASANTATISGRVNLRGDGGYSSAVFTVADGTASTDLLVSAAVTELFGSVGITKNGAGTMVLTGDNSFSGGLAINGGHVRFSSTTGYATTSTVTLNNPGSFLLMDQANQFGPSAGIFFNSSGGHNEFALYGHDQTIASLASANVFAVVQNSHGGFGPASASSTLTINQSSNTTYSGIIRDNIGNDAFTLGIVKTGNGTLALTSGGANSNYSGGTTVDQGTLSATRGALGTGAVVVNNGGTLYANDQWVFSGANQYGVSFPNPSSLTVNAGGVFHLDATNGFANGVNNLYLYGGSVTGGNNADIRGALFLYNGNEQITSGGTTTSSIGVSVGLTGNNNTITVDGGSTLNMTGEVKNSDWFGPNTFSGGFIKAGSGTLYLTGANTYTGTTTISDGTLQLDGGAFTTTARDYSIASGAALQLGGGGTLIPASGTSNISGAGTFRILNGTSLNNTTGPGRNITIAMSSGGSIDIQTGASLFNGGWQNITWTSNLAGMNVDGTFDIWDGNSVRIDALTGSGTVNKTHGGNSPTLLTVGVNNGSGTFSGTIANASGVIALTKEGSGTQTLTGANSYTGTTTVAGGTLELGSGGSMGGTSLVNVGLSGNGGSDTLRLNNPTHLITTTISAGSTGHVNVGVTEAGTVTVDAGAYSIGGQLRIGGIATGGTASTNGTVTVNSGATLQVNGATTIIDSAGTALLDVNGGSYIEAGGQLRVGDTAVGTGTVRVRNGGTATITGGDTLIGNLGTGIVEHTGGTVNIGSLATARNIDLGFAGGSANGTYTMDQSTGTSLLNAYGNMTIGNNLTNTGPATQNVFTLNAGTVNFHDTASGTQLTAGLTPSTLTIRSDGTFDFSGGVLMNVTTITADPLSPATAGIFTQDGGRFVVGVDGDLDSSLAVRALTTINGNFDQNGGTLAIDIFGPDVRSKGGEAVIGSHGAFNPVTGTGGIGLPSPFFTDSDLLYVDGNAILDGILEIDTNGASLTPWGWYDVVVANNFDMVGPNFSLQGVSLYRVIEDPSTPGRYILQVGVPEPASVLLWSLIGLVGLAGAVRLRRRVPLGQ